MSSLRVFCLEHGLSEVAPGVIEGLIFKYPDGKKLRQYRFICPKSDYVELGYSEKQQSHWITQEHHKILKKSGARLLEIEMPEPEDVLPLTTDDMLDLHEEIALLEETEPQGFSFGSDLRDAD